MNDPFHDTTDLPARAAYQAACDAKGVKPNWGKTGFQSKVEYWRSIAAAAINPVEPTTVQKPQKMLKQPTPLTSDLSNIAIKWNESRSVFNAFLGIPEEDESPFEGRMKHFQRLGFACEKRGSGTPSILNRENFLKLAFGLLLHHDGMSPSRTIEIFDAIWEELHDALQQMLKGIAEEKPPEPMLLSIYGRDPRVANDWAQVTLKPAQDAIADFKSNDATNVQFLRVDVALSELLESLRANYPPYKRTI
jgi:hypothetical protein